MSRRPVVCIAGPLVGRNPGRVTTQGEKLWDMLTAAGYQVIAVSTSENRYARLSEIATTIVRRRNEIDVLVVFTYGLKSFVVEDVATFLGARAGLPIVMALCGGAFPDFMARFPRWTRRVLRRADRIVCQSAYLQRAVEQRGFHPEIVSNVIDIDDYPFRQRTAVAPRLFWMRAFDDLYNPDLAIRTLVRVRERHPDATLVMAGQDAPYRAEVESEVRRRGLGSAVRFAGFLDLAGKQREAAAADIFLNTPRIDNRPICVVEAAAFGLPVVSTRVGGLSDLLEDGRTGLLVPDNDERAMADAVLRLVDEPALAARLSTQGRALAEQSSISRVLPAWERVLHDMMRER